MNILDYIGSLFGYIIDLGYRISGVYIIGILLFTIAVKLVMLPTSINQQKTQVKQQRIQPRLRELQEIYRNNPTKLQEEQAKLYSKEGVSQFSGCLPLLIQFPVIIGLYQAIVNPLTCVLHLNAEKVQKALELVKEFLPTDSRDSYYNQINLIGQFDSVRDKLATVFSAGELERIEDLAHGAFDFLGLDLLQTPAWTNLLITIPIVCFITSMIMMMQTSMKSGAAGGCSKWGLPIGMSLFMAYIAFSVPGAVGVYWVMSNLLAMVQTFLMNKFYNASILAAQDEARRYARRELEETASVNKHKDVDLELVIARCREKDAEKQEAFRQKQEAMRQKNDDSSRKKKKHW